MGTSKSTARLKEQYRKGFVKILIWMGEKSNTIKKYMQMNKETTKTSATSAQDTSKLRAAQKDKTKLAGEKRKREEEKRREERRGVLAAAGIFKERLRLTCAKYEGRLPANRSPAILGGSHGGSVAATRGPTRLEGDPPPGCHGG